MQVEVLTRDKHKHLYPQMQMIRAVPQEEQESGRLVPDELAETRAEGYAQQILAPEQMDMVDQNIVAHINE